MNVSNPDLKFEDSNLAQIGSVYDLALRKERAEAEPEWKKVPSEPALLIWRIEKFNVVPWPKEEYGKFYNGDTYIVLSITKKADDTLNYIAHMWVGKYSSMDESGTGAYKIVELDDYLDRKATLVYNAQDYETDTFNSLFKTIIIMEGGIESGFKKVEPDKYRTRLLHVRGKGSCIHSSEKPLNPKSLNSHDVFVIDAGLKLMNWRGKKSSPFEKFHGRSLCEKIKNERAGKPQIIDAEQGDGKLKDFLKELQQEEEIEDKTNEIPADLVKGCHKKIMKLSDDGGKMEMTEVPYEKGSLKSDDTFLIDRGDNLYIWVGNNASPEEKKYGFVFAKKYQDLEKRNKYLPVIMLKEGEFKKEIDECFK